jgi:alpha-1,6-mannosyltransferase
MLKRGIGAAMALLLTGGLLLITYHLERHQSVVLLSVYSLVFLVYLGLCRMAEERQTFWWLVGLAVVMRVLLLPAVPNLSDDVYRFIWDGRLLVQGVDPFAYLPEDMMQQGVFQHLQGIDQSLFQQLNSPAYFTIYPPVNQAIFASAAWLFPDSVYGSTIIIRSWLLLADMGVMFMIVVLLRNVQLPEQRFFLYALNPLIILELTANLHFEGLMIFFLLMSFFMLQKDRLVISAFFLALAISTKLLPLILLPLYWRRLGTKQAWYLYFVTAVFTVLMFVPLLSYELLAGLSQSVGLYFQKFEFNASVYYIIREIGFIVKGYNIIGSAGKWLAVSTFLAIIIYTILERKNQLPAAWMWVWLIYLALATVVHPWYVTPMLAFSTFSTYRFPVLWSWIIFLSYAGYTSDSFSENLWLTAVEYGLLVAFIGYELYTKYAKKPPASALE